MAGKDALAQGLVNRYLAIMASNGTMKRSSSNGQYLTVRGKTRRGKKVKFGSVTISGTKPSAEEVKSNVARSTAALERVTRKLANPGVMIRTKRNVPQFSVAEGEVGVFVRRLNGRTDRGRLVDGQFRVIE